MTQQVLALIDIDLRTLLDSMALIIKASLIQYYNTIHNHIIP